MRKRLNSVCVNSGLTGFGLDGNAGDTAPAAYLNYILFDQGYNVVTMGWTRVPTSAYFSKQNISIPQVSVKEAGYIFVYLSYEDLSNNYVEFDDFKITHTKSNLIQANEYYPFGLQTANSWTRENTTGNNFLGNGGTELNPTSNLYDLEYRNYDPALGRMHQVDPMTDKYASLTPYNFSFNSPAMFNDPNGADPSPGEPDYVKHRNLGTQQTFDINHSPTYGAGASLFDMTWAGGFGNIGGIALGNQALYDYYSMSDNDYMNKYAEKVNQSQFGNYATAANAAKNQYVLGIIRALGSINYDVYRQNLLGPGILIDKNSITASLSRSVSTGDTPGKYWIEKYESNEKQALALGFAGQVLTENGLGGNLIYKARNLIVRSGVINPDKGIKQMNDVLNLTVKFLSQVKNSMPGSKAYEPEISAIGAAFYFKAAVLNMANDFINGPIIKQINPDYYNQNIERIYPEKGRFAGGGSSGDW